MMAHLENSTMSRMSCRQWQLFPFWKQPLSSQVHPKVAADKYLFMKSFLVIIIKALFQADSNLDFHLTKCLIARLEAESGLVKDYFARYTKKQGRILNSNPVILSAWSLPLLALKIR